MEILSQPHSTPLVFDQHNLPEDDSHSNADANKPNGDANGHANDENTITVFDDNNHFNVKHRLTYTWTLWFTKPPSGQDNNWADLLKKVISFDSVEEFWGIHHNISRASQLGVKSDYHLFKDDIRPEWEDNNNKHGGKWAVQYKVKESTDIDKLWLHVMLAAIGNTLEDDGDNEVQGVVVNVRPKFYRIGLWTRTIGNQGDGKEILKKIGLRFKEALGMTATDTIEFSGHTDAARSGSTRARSKITV